jgi:hypothetical protein
MLKKIAVVVSTALCFLLLAGCGKANNFKEQLKKAGYTNVDKPKYDKSDKAHETDATVGKCRVEVEQPKNKKSWKIEEINFNDGKGEQNITDITGSPKAADVLVQYPQCR